jgi:thiamine-monophosphate kinase
MLVEDVHFKLDYFSAQDVGAKALAVNLSDIAAMGARPHFVHVSLAIPEKIKESWLDGFYEGMATMADTYDCEIVGGDLSKTSDKLVIDVNVHGSCENPITRKGSVPGDLLLCSGPLGLAQTGLMAFLEKRDDFFVSKQKHTNPRPRLDLVDSLQKHREKIHSLIDCSDGLINDALQLCGDALGIRIFADSLPLDSETRALAKIKDMAPHNFALWGGEDYELLMSIPASSRDFFPDWYVLGSFSCSPEVLLDLDGHSEEIQEFRGWRHF